MGTIKLFYPKMFGVFRSREMLKIFKRSNYEIGIGAQILKTCK
jgi:hypothetical protein